MKTRVLSFFMVVILCLSMTACIGNDTTTAKEPTQTVSSSTIVTTTTTAVTVPEDIEEEVVPGSTPLFYKIIDGDGDVVWLLGSIHIAKNDMYPLPRTITAAYENAEALAVECDVVAFETDWDGMGKMMTSWLYDKSGHIYDHISPELYEAAVDILKENDSYSSLYDRYIPSTWSSFIDNIVVDQLGYESEIGIDMYFLDRAYEEGKPIEEIESVEFQNNMTVSFSPPLQELLLESAVEGYHDPDTPAQYEEMINVWRSGDEAAFAAMLATEEEEFESEEEKALYQEYHTAMIVDRNITMTDYAQECLESGKEVFICVGAAHVVGDGAMVPLLRERGYTVELVR